ncbi:hypothetical protein ElyMa_006075200 [Elysia marginata]|uniref:Uncharacterized protein n=1 Tax=Elysia marginata TaxID=1093978 RepID=A0AAV4GNU6_9GAST|nr:hypothetical protein ElyMa_006075200 [Elysia marginata]
MEIWTRGGLSGRGGKVSLPVCTEIKDKSAARGRPPLHVWLLSPGPGVNTGGKHLGTAHKTALKTCLHTRGESTSSTYHLHPADTDVN